MSERLNAWAEQLVDTHAYVVHTPTLRAGIVEEFITDESLGGMLRLSTGDVFLADSDAFFVCSEIEHRMHATATHVLNSAIAMVSREAQPAGIEMERWRQILILILRAQTAAFEGA